MMEAGVVEKNDASYYIRLIDMPEDLRQKFQFHTFAEGQPKLISELTEGNAEKMKRYVNLLIQNGK